MNGFPVDLGYPTGAHGRIPSFNNVQEEDEFWDTHDIIYFLDEAHSGTVVRRSKLGDRLSPPFSD
jgi:hypothetical protein